MDHLHHPRKDWDHAKLYQIFIQIISTRSDVYSGEFYILVGFFVFFLDRGYINLFSAGRMLIYYYDEKDIISFTFLHELETYLLRGMKRHSSRWWFFRYHKSHEIPLLPENRRLCHPWLDSVLCFVRGFKFQMTSFYMLW